MRKKALFVTFLIASISYLAPAQEPVHFEDANLKAAVELTLGITNPTQTDMLSLTNLIASAREISDLTGLEYAVNLRSLYIRLAIRLMSLLFTLKPSVRLLMFL